MRQNPWQVWHRCGTCGTIFSNLDELREHVRQHVGPKNQSPKADGGGRSNFSDIPAHEREFDQNRKKAIAVSR